MSIKMSTLEGHGNLIGLVAQAVSSVTSAEADDLAEFENLRKILDQIDKAVGQISDAPTQVLEDAKGATSKASQAVQQILQHQAKDNSESIKAVSETIASLQTLIYEAA